MNANGPLERQEILAILKNHLNNEEFTLEEFKEKPASESPLGFLGDHCKVRLTISVSGDKRIISYFVKKVPTKIRQHLQYAIETRAFYKEIELYRTLFVDLRNAQSEFPRAPTKWHPEFYYSRNADLFVLEDASVLGYYMYPEKRLMDEDHVKASLKAMAAMHAASIVFEEKFKRGKVETVSPNPPESYLNGGDEAILGRIYSHLTFETEFSDRKGHLGNTFLEAGIRSQVEIAMLLPDYSAEEKRKIAEKLPDVLRKVYQLVKPSDRFKNVFVHGDLWANNFLYRKDNEGKVTDALIIDFQLARYAPPAHDVVTFLHLCQDRTFLDANEKELLKYYHLAFSAELDKNSCSAEALLPWSKFLESCDHYKPLGLLIRLFYFQLTLASSEVIDRILYEPREYDKFMLVDRTDAILESFNTNELYRTRETEAMKEVIEKLILI